jgi:hypothetical protein
MKSLCVVLVSAALAAQAAPATEVKLVPAEVAQIDLSKMNGKLVRQLAWSTDNTELYLQTFTEDQHALPKDVYHYVVPASGGEFKKVAAEPDWAIAYWSWKSGQTAPDDAAFKIEISTDKHLNSPTAMPMGGDFARGGTDGSGAGGASVSSVTAAAQGSTNDTVYTMRLKNEVVGEWVNHAIMPGLTFGWGPKGTHLIAYADKEGRLVVMDSTGAKQRIESTKSVVLPAFTADAMKIAYLEGRGRNKYALVVATVGK